MIKTVFIMVVALVLSFQKGAFTYAALSQDSVNQDSVRKITEYLGKYKKYEYWDFLQTEFLLPTHSPQLVIGSSIDSNHYFAKNSVLIILVSDEGTGICSGSVLTKHFILTAAHCLKSVNEAYIFTNNLISTKDVVKEIRKGMDGKFFKVTKNSFEVSPCYHPSNNSACDIAMIFVPEALNKHDVQVTSVRLIGSGSGPYVLTGYGMPPKTSRPSSDEDEVWVLRGVEVDLFYNDQAIVYTHRRRFGRHVGVVQGDSGGPMYEKASDGSYVQVGVNVAKSTHYNISVKVDRHLSWMQGIMKSRTATTLSAGLNLAN